jgi:hypothetical protein
MISSWLTKQKKAELEIFKGQSPHYLETVVCSIEGVAKLRATYHVKEKIVLEPGDTFIIDFDATICDNNGRGYRGEWIDKS